MIDNSKFVMGVPNENTLQIAVEKIIIKERAIEMFSDSVEMFAGSFDKLVFTRKDGKRTIFVKEKEE